MSVDCSVVRVSGGGPKAHRGCLTGGITGGRDRAGRPMPRAPRSDIPSQSVSDLQIQGNTDGTDAGVASCPCQQTALVTFTIVVTASRIIDDAAIREMTALSTPTVQPNSVTGRTATYMTDGPSVSIRHDGHLHAREIFQKQ